MCTYLTILQFSLKLHQFSIEFQVNDCSFLAYCTVHKVSGEYPRGNRNTMQIM